MKFIMADGRAFTEWRSSCRINDEIKNKLNIKDDNDYRLYLQRHGMEVKDKILSKFPAFKYCPVCEQAVEQK